MAYCKKYLREINLDVCATCSVSNKPFGKCGSYIQEKENMCKECGQECCDYVKEINAELDAYKLLLDSAHMILLNANDFFGYACADAVELDTSDLNWVIPIVQKYGDDGIAATMSYIRKCKPIEPRIDEKFEQAYKEIKELKPKVWSESEK